MNFVMRMSVTGSVFEWRGPSPYHFVALSPEQAADLDEIARSVTYGWGMIPVTGRIGGTTFETSLWRKEGTYYVPLKDAVRRAEGIAIGTMVTVALSLRLQ